MTPDEELQSALNAAYFYLKFRPRSRKEVETYLIKKSALFNWSEEIVGRALESLERNKYINDQSFVEWFVSSRNSSKQKSEYLLRGELLRFGIDKSLLDIYFAENTQDDVTLATQALQTRWNRLHELSPRDRLQKAAVFLQRRGFSWETIKKVVDKLEQNR